MAEPTIIPRTLEVRGKTLRFYPLVRDDFESWEGWAREQFLKAAYKAAASIPDLLEQRTARREALDVCGWISFGSGRAAGQMTSVDGKLEAVMLSMRHAPDEKDHKWSYMQRSEAWELFFGATPTPADYQALTAAWNLVLKASGLVPEDTSDADPQTLAVMVTNATM